MIEGRRPGGTSRLDSFAKFCTSTSSVGGGSATLSSRSMKYWHTRQVECLGEAEVQQLHATIGRDQP
jgi:hypothetical protein